MLTRLGRPTRLSAWFGILICVFVIVWNSPSVLAADIEVDGTDCSLADAITAANTDTETNGCTAGDGADEITLSADVTLAAALPVITATLTIDGDGHTISGDDTYAILVVEGADLTVEDVTLTEGSGINGGGVYIQDGNLIVDNVDITENVARDHGGGIYATNGTLDVKGNSEVTHNTAGDSGGGIWVNNVNATIADSEISENETSASGGGGIYYTSATGDNSLEIQRSTFSGNTSKLDGGAIRISNGTGRIVRSSFTENTADDGGGIKAYNASLNIENTTISTNTARVGAGLSSLGVELTLTHVTLAYNTATENGGGLLINGSDGSLKIRNTLITGTVSGGDCDSGPNEDIITENVGNWIQDGSCAPQEVVETTATPEDQEDNENEEGSTSQIARAIAQQSEDESEKQDALLGNLIGEAAYHPLNRGSPAIDTAEEDYCLDVDQPGTPRPQGGICDVGAYELPVIVPTATLRPTATSRPTATATAIPSATPTLNPTATPVKCTHTVVPGDTLFDLALTFGTTVEAIQELNRLTDDLLSVGHELFIPDCEFTPDTICSDLPPGTELRTESGGVPCEVVEISELDKHPLMNAGIIVAFDLWGGFVQGAEVCSDDAGSIVFMNTATSPPQVARLETWIVDGKICAVLEKPGTVVMVEPLTEASSIPLTDCQVTTSNVVRLRNEAGGDVVHGLVPYNVVFSATARTAGWINVEYLGMDGWISADHVSTQGQCG